MLCPNCNQHWAPFYLDGKKMTDEQRMVVFKSPKRGYCSPDCDDEHRESLLIRIQQEEAMKLFRRNFPKQLPAA